MWRFMQESKLPKTTEEGIERVLTSEKGYAFIGAVDSVRVNRLNLCF